jgi:transposase
VVPTMPKRAASSNPGPAVEPPLVFGGVDTHADTHTVAAISHLGAMLGHQSFPATPAGYRQLFCWLTSQGTLARVGVEGTGSYGAGLTAALTDRGVRRACQIVCVRAWPPR